MLSRRTFRLGMLIGGWALLVLCARPVAAQEETKPEETTKTEVDEQPTPWPPPNTQKNEVKREPTQEKGLILHTPAAWKKDEETKPLRLAQFTIPPAQGEKDPVELAVFSFQGLGGGGGVQANVDRWVSQFPGPGTKKTVMTGTGHQGLYVLVDLEGTYQPGVSARGEKQDPIPNARMLAAIIGIRWDGKDADGTPKQKSAVYFLKMVGPKKTIDENEKAFRLAFGASNKENPIPEKEE